MTIELNPVAKQAAIASIQRYFEQNMEEKIGNIAAGGLLGFFLQEIAPSVYNQAVADAQACMHVRIDEIDYEVHKEEFQYWQKYGKAASAPKPRR